MEDAIATALEALRDFINSNARVKARLTEDRSSWIPFCSALDVAEDTQRALRAYGLCRSGDLDSQYLALYGALQALVVQQDAVRRILTTIGLAALWKDERLRDLRGIRVLGVGHPMKADHLAGRPSSFMIQVSLRPGQFELLTLDESGNQATRTVSVDSMLSDQETILSGFLRAARDHLVEKDSSHKDKYKGQPLSRILTGVRWNLGKAQEMVDSTDPSIGSERGRVELSMVKAAVDHAEAALVERGEYRAHQSTLEPQFRLLRHCLTRMNTFFEKACLDEEQRLDAEAFGVAMSDSFQGLVSFLEDLDKDYE